MYSYVFTERERDKNVDFFTNVINVRSLTEKRLINKLAKLIKPEVFSCEFCKNVKNTICTKHLQTTAYT